MILKQAKTITSQCTLVEVRSCRTDCDVGTELAWTTLPRKVFLQPLKRAFDKLPKQDEVDWGDLWDYDTETHRCYFDGRGVDLFLQSTTDNYSSDHTLSILIRQLLNTNNY